MYSVVLTLTKSRLQHSTLLGMIMKIRDSKYNILYSPKYNIYVGT